MKFSVALSSLALLGEFALAQTIQSKPFRLVTLSKVAKYNNVGLFPCHEGAGIEALCSGQSSQTYNLNRTTGQQSGVPGDNPPGVLVYSLPVSGGNVSSGMTFYADPSTNVALPLFYPGIGETYVSFDSKNLLNIQAYLNDTVTPPTDNKAYALYRWYVCTTNQEGYVYNTLSWVYGNGAPQNPSCAKVDVQRIFA